ncbi:M14 family metallopeptidase [Rhodovibrionaceae bacterium A322]
MTAQNLNYDVEIAAPDISDHKESNSGVDYIWTFDSGQPGPHVMVSAVVHGNELCGAVAVDWLLREKVRPTKGKLSLGFMNVDALLAFDPENPFDSRYVDEDFNRLWTAEVLEGDRQSKELTRARAVRGLIDTVDHLLDIHSMSHKVPPLMMAGPLAKGRKLAQAVGVPEIVVNDAGHAAGKRLRDYADFADPASDRNALLVECGQHWEAGAVPLAKQSALRFLKHYDVVDPAFLAKHLDPAEVPPQRCVEVTTVETISSEDFAFVAPYIGGEVIEKAGTVLAKDGDREIVTPYDNCMLIMPTPRPKVGQTAVRLGRFIDG